MNAQGPRLIVIEGKLKGRVFDLTGPTIMGRQEGVQIPLNDGKVSREHAKVYQQGAEVVIVDLNSRNGTLVNDAKITKRVLHPGDEILVGETRFRFESAAAAPSPAAAAPATAKPAVKKEVVDLTVKPPPAPAAPAGAVRSDQIVVKDRALQFSKFKNRKGGGFLFGDLTQRSLGFQILMGLLVIAACVLFVLLGIEVAGSVRGGG
ncbi:MAG: FHA domain-containing protein [Planctomycetes bacterium]|nr:FHA domain-containing protein [Planctomycetota bacterium]